MVGARRGRAAAPGDGARSGRDRFCIVGVVQRRAKPHRLEALRSCLCRCCIHRVQCCESVTAASAVWTAARDFRIGAAVTV